MTFANTTWAANVALEVLCLWFLGRRARLSSALGVFVVWQLTADLVNIFFRDLFSPHQFSYLYWGEHTVTYLLFPLIYRPRRYNSVFGVYWIASYVATLAAIVNVWSNNHHMQYQLALCCGSLAVFSTLVGYISSQHVMLSRTGWSALWVWGAGQVVAATLSPDYSAIYTTSCAISLALFAVGLSRVRDFAPDRETLLTRPKLYPIFSADIGRS